MQDAGAAQRPGSRVHALDGVGAGDGRVGRERPPPDRHGLEVCGHCGEAYGPATPKLHAIDAAALRSEFPVLDELAYLNAGSNGPAPLRARAAADEAVQAQVDEGRGGSAFFDRMLGAAGELRSRVAGVVSCEPDEMVLTGSTTDGVNIVLSGLGLGPGDEVVTTGDEHPGLLVPLAVGARRHGYTVRQAPFAEIAQEAGSARLIACSHVSWITGEVVDTDALGATDALVLLDGAQGLGAVPVDVQRLGCDFYAASGQKWMCGPVGSGYLYVPSTHLDALTPAWPNFGTVADPGRPLEDDMRPGAERFELGLRPPEHTAWSAVALDVLEAAGFDDVLAAAADGAERLADRLRETGRTVAPRGRSTLVSWEERDPPAIAERLLGSGVVVRHLPGRPYVRASVGAWTSEGDIERLLSALA